MKDMQAKQSKMVTFTEYWLGIDALRNIFAIVSGIVSGARSIWLTAIVTIPLLVYLYANWRYQDHKLFFIKLSKRTYSLKENKIILGCGYFFVIGMTVLALFTLGTGFGDLVIVGLFLVSVLAGWYYFSKTKFRFK